MNSICLVWRSQSISWVASLSNHVRHGAWMPGGNGFPAAAIVVLMCVDAVLEMLRFVVRDGQQ